MTASVVALLRKCDAANPAFGRGARIRASTIIRALANSAACGASVADICTPLRAQACRRKVSTFPTYYSRTEESNNARVAWAFEGIDYDEKLGNFGLVGGGAAGTELDIVDTMLGSPPHTLVVATSAGRHTEGYLLVMEDYRLQPTGTRRYATSARSLGHRLPRDAERRRVLCILIHCVLRRVAVEQRRQQHLEACWQRSESLYAGRSAAHS